ncbi:MAG: UDP-N-acetylglucosamine 2-epimerase (non-hydrolyzing) [Coriobacteriia bacterium]|nr:UDP-N-acetylglucosamine 2-epimerase (non-hydrolyzing) [Coriobacteriia bacterium]MCL2537479.1 UDP-N-acetylglucosamine 2-epimerase (non-hydrolyzing) [Coriobacteriia bacterium]
MKWISVVGARPNFIKIAPFVHAIAAYNAANPDTPIEHILVHTGQHYDDKMSKAFFEQLNIPEADLNLNIGSGSHAQQVGNTMIAFEEVCQTHQPDLVVVVGDVNATAACSITAKKLNIPVAHIEAGLRSGDRSMPEEINRLVTDSISDILLAPDHFATDNLAREGHDQKSIHLSGNIMIDTLDVQLPKAQALPLPAGLEADNYVVVTLHRPANVDDPKKLASLVAAIMAQADAGIHMYWPVHPRTRANLAEFDQLPPLEAHPNITLTQPIGYVELLRLNLSAKAFLTDSGGLQEECCVVGTPCVTLRDNTERPVTLKAHGGTNVLSTLDTLPEDLAEALATPRKPYRPENWDGQTAPRMVQTLLN